MPTVTLTPPQSTTVTGFSGGVTGSAGQGTVYQIDFSGTWAVGDSFTLQMITASQTFDFGTGRVYGFPPVACLTYAARVHFVSGTYWLGSDNNDATAWEQQAPGAFKTNAATEMSIPDAMVSLAIYQGRIALFSRNESQIWVVDPNPINITFSQGLTNIGTFAGLGPQSLGELDVLFPYDSGVRSLRARDLSLNAVVNDIGSAIDTLITTAIAGQSSSTLAASVAIVDPSANRYWLWIPGSQTIYVLSYFPSSKIIAWSTYLATGVISGTTYNLTPIKFCVYKGRTYMLASAVVGGFTGNYLFLFGGTGNATYDSCVATLQTQFFDAKCPGHTKQAQYIDVDVSGSWQVQATQDWIDGTLINVDTAASQATFDQGRIAFSAEGTHFSMELQTTDSTAASIAQAILYYSIADAPVDD